MLEHLYVPWCHSSHKVDMAGVESLLLLVPACSSMAACDYWYVCIFCNQAGWWTAGWLMTASLVITPHHCLTCLPDVAVDADATYGIGGVHRAVVYQVDGAIHNLVFLSFWCGHVFTSGLQVVLISDHCKP